MGYKIFVKRQNNLIVDTYKAYGDVETPEGFTPLESSADADYQAYLNKTGDYAPKETYIDKRLRAYGSPIEQLEYITENGLQAWQDHVSSIKQQYPKPEG